MNGPRRRPERRLAGGLFALAAGLAGNTLLGPLVTGVVTYPFSDALVSQTVGLEAFTLLVVVPVAAAAGVLVLRGHPTGPPLAVAPGAYTVYMLAQYVVGPAYTTYRPVVALHLALFVLGGVVLALAWTGVRDERLPALAPRRRRRAAVGLVALAAFITLRYLPSFVGMATGGPLTAEFAADPTMFWTIFLLDLGVVVPVTAATALGLRRGATWARRALFAVAGWYALVPASVAVMSAVMLANGDPYATVGGTAAFTVAALLFTAFAVWVYRPLFRRAGRPGTTGRVGGRA
jgi:hypothetical protein